MADSGARNVLKLVRDLRRRKARERRDLVLLEGQRLVDDARQAGAVLEALLVADDVADGAATAGLPVQVGPRRDFDAVADTETPGGVLAVARWEPRPLATLAPPAPRALMLVLDGVQDPGNVGTMIRTAHALGAAATIALEGTADVRSPKVLRAAMGSHFRHAVVETSFDELVAWNEAAGARVLVASAGGSPVEAVRAGREAVLLVVGNEAHGPRAAWVERPHRQVAVPMRGDAESLNAAVAAGILLFELLRDAR